MVMLIVTFCYTGLMMTFWSSTYGSFINDKSLVGLHGIFSSVGEVIAGIFYSQSEMDETKWLLGIGGPKTFKFWCFRRFGRRMSFFCLFSKN